MGLVGFLYPLWKRRLLEGNIQIHLWESSGLIRRALRSAHPNHPDPICDLRIQLILNVLM